MRTLLLSVLLTFGWSMPALGQHAPARFTSLELQPFEAPVPPLSHHSLSRSTGPEGSHSTRNGFLIGVGVGLALGWLTYDTFCEAVNNRCTPSPVRLLVVGGALGGAFGALIGSLVD